MRSLAADSGKVVRTLRQGFPHTAYRVPQEAEWTPHTAGRFSACYGGVLRTLRRGNTVPQCAGAGWREDRHSSLATRLLGLVPVLSAISIASSSGFQRLSTRVLWPVVYLDSSRSLFLSSMVS